MKNISVEEADAMFAFGGDILGGSAKIFMEEARRRGLDDGDAVLLLCSLLLTKAVSVVRAMVPGEETRKILHDMVEEVWNGSDRSN